jgi:phospholipase/lecithinase/hemolysin
MRSPSLQVFGFRLRFFDFLALLAPFGFSVRAQQAPAFTQIVVFGDSLSDAGNDAHRADARYSVRYPSKVFNYTDARFTDGSDTTPSAAKFAGVWHEQLARIFLNLTPAGNSLDAGSDFAFGGATTNDGSTEKTLTSSGDLTITIDNLGKQVDDYLAAQSIDPDALYIIWGGTVDLLDDASASSVTATVRRMAALVNRLASAGARNFAVPNVPPLGSFPHFSDAPDKEILVDEACADYRRQLKTVLNNTIQAFGNQDIALNIYPVDVWQRFVQMFAAPGDFGLVDISRPARGLSVNADEFLFWDDIHPTTAGHFQIASEANRAITNPESTPGKALNISTRVSVGTDANVSIAGFIVTGSTSKKVIIRGIGPSLKEYGVTTSLADPTLALYDQSGTLLASNDNWKQSQRSEIEATTLAPKNELEAAIVNTLQPGNYTAVLAGTNGSTGIGLVEVYDLGSESPAALANVSTRGFVGTDDNAMIGGFIVGTGSSAVVVVRAIGPSLKNSGLAGALLDPILELHNSDGSLLAFNDDWRTTQAEAIKATLLAPRDDRESAIVASLDPGNYTIVVRGKNDTTGVALVEAYRIE